MRLFSIRSLTSPTLVIWIGAELINQLKLTAFEVCLCRAEVFALHYISHLLKQDLVLLADLRKLPVGHAVLSHLTSSNLYTSASWVSRRAPGVVNDTPRLQYLGPVSLFFCFHEFLIHSPVTNWYVSVHIYFSNYKIQSL